LKRLINGVLLDTDKAKKIADSVDNERENIIETLYEQKINTTWYEDTKYFLTDDDGMTVLGGVKDEEFHKTKSLVLSWIGSNFIDDELIKVLKKSVFYGHVRNTK
jgi:hypothetical protein|tara:strand:- start:13991 stop:14305 length:315 start_codon:yes stop_codon:yes gene_type:complete